MKKLFTLILAVVMVLALVACGEGNDNATTDENTDIITNTAEATDGTPTTTESTAGGDSDADTTSPDATPDTTAPTTDSITNTTPVTQLSHTHSYVSTVTAPTCTNGGYTTYKCACGDSYIGDKVSSVGHSFGQWETTKAATATATGTAQRICDKCNARETKTLGKLLENHLHAHKQELTKVPTCIQEGTWTYTCSCGDTFTESHPKIDHTYKSSTVIANCLNSGYEEHTCSVCGYSFRTDFVSRDHTYAKTEQPATCTKNGYTKYTCTVCGASYAETINALGHDFRAISCESNMVCDRCGGAGDYFEHNWRGYVEDGKPSLEKPNYCGLCGIVWCDYYGHIWGSDGHCMWRFCDECIPE